MALDMYYEYLFTQVDLPWDKVDLIGNVIYKWVPTHGIYFILLKILPAKSRAG